MTAAPKRYLVDTDVIIDAFRKIDGAGPYLNSLGEWSYSTATAMELFFGARSKKEIRAIEKSLAQYSRVPISHEVGELALDIVKKYAKSDGTGELDALIAATAISGSFRLASKNRKHFRNIEGLDIEVQEY